ncbi:hypothetical protein PIB30_070272 [Stylosanthes scabra]|uniref:Uncharacterized protein n=1 Tax=Stylosanthes scabra TaxID=79078 RepID=A0ABU6UNE0_9FABA|nr:hypothetical protein [Stylosanthes scabra]
MEFGSEIYSVQSHLDLVEVIELSNSMGEVNSDSVVRETLTKNERSLVTLNSMPSLNASWMLGLTEEIGHGWTGLDPMTYEAHIDKKATKVSKNGPTDTKMGSLDPGDDISCSSCSIPPGFSPCTCQTHEKWGDVESSSALPSRTVDAEGCSGGSQSDDVTFQI